MAAAATGTYTLSALNRRPTTAAAAVYAASRENRAIAVALNHKRIGANRASERASEREREREKRESFSDGPTPSRLRGPMCRSIGSTSRRRARINKPRSPHFPPAISYDSQSLNVSRFDFPPVSLSLSLLIFSFLLHAHRRIEVL